MIKILTAACVLCFINLSCIAQLKIIKPDLSSKSRLQTLNRNVTFSNANQGGAIIHFDAKPGAGAVWIKDVNFSTGTIEFDVKGKDVLQESFVGIAFHATNDSTYEGVYFRPFNFKATDEVRRKHAIQYISLPKYDWFYLRETYPDKYEHSLNSPVNPDDWFHVKIIVTKNNIEAFVNSDTQPCLSVQPLTHVLSGVLGFWVGNGSDGEFCNLLIEHK